MQPIFVVLLAAGLAAAQTAPDDDSGSLSGRVVSSLTGEAVRKVEVILTEVPAAVPSAARTQATRPAETQPQSSSPNSFSASTDASGEFVFSQLAPGKYSLYCRRAGFTACQKVGEKEPGTAARPTVTIGRREALKNFNLSAPPAAVLAGRVLDQDGDPLVNARVQLLQDRAVSGRRRLQLTKNVTTDDRGQYRLYDIPAGSYYLTADPASTPLPVATRQPVSQVVPITTYYPNSPSVATASRIKLSDGGRMEGIDLHLLTARPVCVRGRVQGQENGIATVLLRSNAPGVTVSRATPVDRATGSFEFRGVSPGSYVGLVSAGTMNSNASGTPIEVGTQDVDGVVLMMETPIALDGALRFDSPATAQLAGIRIIFTSQDGNFMVGVTAVTDATGAFRVNGLTRTAYTLRFSGQDGARTYVKSLKLGGTALTGSVVDLAQGGAGPLEIVLSTHTATLSGSVVDPATSQPVNGAFVVLVPSNPTQGLPSQTSTSGDGSFQLAGIAPVKYKAYAWRDNSDVAYLEPDYMKAYESRAVEVELSEDGQSTIALEVLSPTAGQP